jgi:hypothetical protein
MGKNIFSEFEGNNWAKSASGNVASQALSACLAESQFKRCDAQQMLCFWATVLLSGHLFGGGVVGTKNQQRHFSNQVDTKAVH